MKYDEETLKQINDNADLIAYAERTMELKKKSDTYFTHCPFHEDKTPSLAFNPTNNYYHCFSCGKSGRMVGFLMDFEGLPFEQAVGKAAKLANVDIKDICQSDTIIFLKQWRNLKKTKENQNVYIHPILPQNTMDSFSKTVIQEWEDEGIKQEVMDTFGVRVDDISNRIVYPVCDINGNLINVKGRTRYENFKKLKLPKYINYYTVGTMDYFQGLNITLPYVKENNEIIIFESVKSVMKAYGWGFCNCVSAETHSLTKEQISLLVKLRTNIVFAYDTDVDYKTKDIQKSINMLRKVTNVFVIQDPKRLLGGAETKNAPVDCGQAIWEELYTNKRKVV